MEENNLNNVPQQPVTPPPIQPAQKKKSNVGLIIGIGCGALVIIGIIIAIIVAVSVLIFASSGKKMKCTYSKSTYGCVMNVDADIRFKGNRADKVNMTGYVDCSASSYKDTMLNTFESTLKSQSDVINVKRNGDKVTFDYKDQAGINLSDPANSKVGVTYEDAKKKMEASGYKCE